MGRAASRAARILQIGIATIVALGLLALVTYFAVTIYLAIFGPPGH